MEQKERERLAILLLKGLSVDEVSDLTELIIEERNEWHEKVVKKLKSTSVNSSFTAKEVIDVLDECDHLDDARMFFNENK